MGRKRRQVFVLLNCEIKMWLNVKTKFCTGFNFNIDKSTKLFNLLEIIFHISAMQSILMKLRIYAYLRWRPIDPMPIYVYMWKWYIKETSVHNFMKCLPAMCTVLTSSGWHFEYILWLWLLPSSVLVCRGNSARCSYDPWPNQDLNVKKLQRLNMKWNIYIRRKDFE